MKAQLHPLLVVDDEENNRNLLSRRLERAGFTVETASDGPEALALIRQKEYELVLLDNMMPGLTGLDILRLLRATYSPEQLPVIMVTALSESQSIVEAIELGANDYVTKPLDYPVALARIRSQLGRKAAERALLESEQRYALAAQGADDGLWDWNVGGNTIYFSSRWKDILGYSEDEISTEPEQWFSRVAPEDRAALECALRAYWTDGGIARFEQEHRMIHKSGAYRWVLCRGLAVRGEDGAVVRMTGWLTDVTETRAYDTLTHLPNRLLFDDRLRRALEQRREPPHDRFAVLFIDLDGFKLVNDSFGHATGDQLLMAVAGRLRHAVRTDLSRGDDALIARLGGDEFAILIENISQTQTAEQIAERILQSLRAPFPLDGRDVFCTASIGVAMSEARYTTAADILRDADIAMYRAKAKGKGCWMLFDDAMREHLMARLELQNDLQSALLNQEMEVFYQPKIQLSSREISGFEALIRWRHPRKGMVAPAEFIPIAEETGMIVDMGAWVLETACRQIYAWNRHTARPRELVMNVNVSPRQIHSPRFVDTVRQVIADTGIAPEWLDLEVTESVLLEDATTAIAVLQSIKQLGVGLSMDDFGTGYSSLSYLGKLPFDTLKIDRSFIEENGWPGANQELVKTILAMAGELGLHVVAEGIESERQASALHAMGCQSGQGFYFSKPVTPEAAEALLDS